MYTLLVVHVQCTCKHCELVVCLSWHTCMVRAEHSYSPCAYCFMNFDFSFPLSLPPSLLFLLSLPPLPSFLSSPPSPPLPSQAPGGGRQKRTKNQSSRSAAVPPPSSDSNRALYQPLTRVPSNPGGNETYAGLNPATMETPPLPPSNPRGAGGASAGGGAGNGIRGDFYMQLNPQTRSPAESQQYMGLKDVRTQWLVINVLHLILSSLL